MPLSSPAKRLFQSILANRRYQALVFAIGFGIIGAVLLYATRAATPSVSSEAENSTRTSGATIVDDSGASSGKAVVFTNPPVVTPTIKPQIKGALDRDAYDFSKPTSAENLKIPTAYRSVVNNFVIKINWSQIQPNNSAELQTAQLDDAVAEARANNMHIKMRIMAGISSPEWVKVQAGRFSVYDEDQITHEVFTGDSAKYWTPAYKSAYANLMNKLAARYDTEPVVASVVNSMCSTIFAEPFIKNLEEGSNLTSFYAAGLTDALDQQCYNESVDVHNAAWKYTRTETAINPLSYKGTNSTGQVVERFNVDFTLAWETRCRQILGVRCIMGNNGFNAVAGADGSNYRRVIGGIICSGNPPPYFQTRQYSVLTSTGNSIASVLSYAIRVGAGMVEMPEQYKTVGITPAQLAPLDVSLEANNVIACPADRLLPNP